MHDDVPGNVAAHLVQENGDAAAAIAAAPHRLDARPRRSSGRRRRRWRAGGAAPAGTPTTRRLRIWTSTQTSTGVRAAVAAKLGLALAKVDVITPDVGGGFGVKIVHPWPEEVLVPWAARLLGQPGQVDRGPARALHLQRARARRSSTTSGSGSTTTAGCSASTSGSGTTTAPTSPYGLIVPIITSTQLLGPYKPGAYRVEFDSLYTNTVIVTPYRGAGRPQGVFVMERTMDAIAAALGLDRTEVRERNFIQPDEMPYDQGLIFQDGRPLIYDSGDYPAPLAKLKELIGWDELRRRTGQAAAAQGRRVGHRAGLLRRGHRGRPVRGRATSWSRPRARSRSRPA